MPSYAEFTATVRSGLAGWVPDVVAAATATASAATGGSARPRERALAAEALAFLRRGGQLAAEAWMQALRHHLDGGAPVVADDTGPGGPSSLMLIAEDRIDEDIEIARIGQRVDAEAERELRQLAALCSTLAARDGVHAEAVPMPPLACARALREALTTLALTADVRLVLLRHLGAALGSQLPALYAQQVRVLVGWGVKPAPYRIRLPGGRHHEAGAASQASGGAPAAGAGPSAAPPAAAQASSPAVIHPELTASLERLVAWARNQADALSATTIQADAPAADDAPPPLRLLDEPAPAASLAASHPPLQGEAAARLMQQLFEQIERQSALSQTALALLQRLKGAANRISEQQAEVWQHFDHPWWQLLDRIISLGTVHADEPGAGFDPVTTTMGQMVDRLQRSRTIDRVQCADAVSAIDRATDRWLDDRGEALGPEVAALQTQAEQRETGQAIRQQIVAQLRAAPVPDVLRRFLVGPWVLAMTATALRSGTDSDALAAQAQLLDELQQAGRERVPREQRRLLIAGVRAGLVQAGLDTQRIDAEMLELAGLLRKPPQMPPVLAPAPDEDDDDPAALRPDLPTVPIDMFEAGGPTAASQDREVWLDSLAPGTRCRMFLLDRWMTTQLTWVSPNRRLYVFNSRHGGRVHSMTRRVLDKLRNAGMAATLERGRLLAEAMDGLTDLGALDAG